MESYMRREYGEDKYMSLGEKLIYARTQMNEDYFYAVLTGDLAAAEQEFLRIGLTPEQAFDEKVRIFINRTRSSSGNGAT